MTVSTLIIGLGKIGMGYDLRLDSGKHIYSHARAFSLHPKFQLIGGVDPDRQQCRIFTETYGCPAYGDVETALGKHQPDLVVIAVPTRYHGQVLRQVLERLRTGTILCEKPLSCDLSEAKSMVLSSATCGVRLYVNYMRRSDPGVIEIRKSVV